MAGDKGFLILLICIFLAATGAVRISENGQKVIYLPKGESIKLGCPFVSDPEDNTPDNDWDIEWKQVKPGPYPQDNPLLSYHDHRIIYPGPPDLQRRVGFTSADPSLYDASMQLSDVQITDSATYECKVKKTTEASHRVTITVQERPAVPQCWIIGDITYGQDIILRCFASVGSPPLSYHWSMMGEHKFRGRLPPGGSMGSSPGDLHIYDLGEDHVGTYQCRVGNNVGVAYCSVDIYFSGGIYQHWIIGGSVVVGLLGLALIASGVTWCWWCCCGTGQCPGCYCGDDYFWDCCCSCGSGPEMKQECMETKGSEICVDANAPPSRPCSQTFSQGSNLSSLFGYQLQNGQYTQGRKYAPPALQVKKTSPPDRDMSIDLSPDFPSTPNSEQSDFGNQCNQCYVPQRDLYPLTDSSPYVKRKNQSSQSHIYSSQQDFNTPTADQSCVRWKDGNTKRYKTTVVTKQSSSKQGLLI
ncbi:V-set and immunoglobulin domain-containing protein 8-like [Sceloporus undulatus]|uniref:V-set and immunoglobulin domain-containing protein 8-like n=1 Tax=Sceloporus undulatus TaxID=8520 RepID=UPI001C4B72E5|nr:V-set and immunoglobulin domain-containing protein 8-like [Sceloporus undulatus]